MIYKAHMFSCVAYAFSSLSTIAKQTKMTYSSAFPEYFCLYRFYI